MLLLWKRRLHALRYDHTGQLPVNKDGAWIVDGGVQLQFNLEENAGNDEEAGENSGEASYEYDAYDLIGTYTSEDGEEKRSLVQEFKAPGVAIGHAQHDCIH